IAADTQLDEMKRHSDSLASAKRLDTPVITGKWPLGKPLAEVLPARTPEIQEFFNARCLQIWHNQQGEPVHGDKRDHAERGSRRSAVGYGSYSRAGGRGGPASFPCPNQPSPSLFDRVHRAARCLRREL